MSQRCSACHTLQDVLDNHKVHIRDANLSADRCERCGSLGDVLDNHKLRIEPLDDVRISSKCERCGSLGDVLDNHKVRISDAGGLDISGYTLDDVLVNYHIKVSCL